MKTDVLIIGSGIAGLYSALNISSNLSVTIITKDQIDCCNSALAQGGICVARDEDDFDSFIMDTYIAGGKQNNKEALEVLVKESRANINRLIDLGVEFDKSDGDFNYTKEGAHSINRILHCEDKTGAVVHDVLVKRCKERKNINIIENCCMKDLIIENGLCVASLIEMDDKKDLIYAKKFILATGGIGGLFKSTTNKSQINGEGLEIALKAGFEMKDLDKIQFHPTAFYEDGKKERFLISESVRGEGAILINHNGERFVDELKPRDVVTAEIHKEIKRTNQTHVLLDMRHLGREFIVKRFPWIYKQCLVRGIDITKDLIPILPAQHYIMGGIKVDLNSKTSIANVYAVGEVSCTGVHGNNRLASNSLLESIVFSYRASSQINTKNNINENNIKILDVNREINENRKNLLDTILSMRGDLKDELCSY